MALHPDAVRNDGRGTTDHRWFSAEPGTAAAYRGQTAAEGGAAADTADGTSAATATGGASATERSTGIPAAAAAQPRSAVNMQEAVDAVRATVTAAARAGVTSARISLSPQALGGIRISLTQTADGLIARVAADHPEAAQTLQQSAGELRRSLESSGLSLLRLDIDGGGEQSAGGSREPGRGEAESAARSADTAEVTPADAQPTRSTLTVELTDGSRVDVFA